jgi:Leucine-rich repeat (LRR) protein
MDNTDDDIQMEKEEYKGRVIPLSLINKSCIQRVSMMRKGIKELPIVRSITQELNLSDNLLQSIPLNFPHLKILIVDHNQINRIPEQISQITTLRHLSANHNQVTLLPFLKHITHL